MGKKSKQKQLRKGNKPAPQPQGQAAKSKTNPGFTLTVDMPTNSQPTTVTAAAPTSKPHATVAMESEEYIRHDIKRIILTLAVLVIILIAAVVVNDKTTLLHTAGKHLASFLKLQ